MARNLPRLGSSVQELQAFSEQTLLASIQWGCAVAELGVTPQFIRLWDRSLPVIPTLGQGVSEIL